MRKWQTRRSYLLTLGATSVLGLAGCSQITGTEPETPENENLSSADFSFEYLAGENQISIRYDGGADIVAGDLQIRSAGGLEVRWPQLGSTVVSPDELIEPGATAVLGETILNWGEAMARDDTIRLVHVGGDAPATLGRFTPPESASLTSTVPTRATETPTEESDTTAPSISVFSLTNPSSQTLRTSFESNERLSSIQVTISGAEEATLTENDFTESLSGGIYMYEATYEVGSEGEYTVTLDEASDRSGNDGSNNESVTVTISASQYVFADEFEDGDFDTNTWSVSQIDDETYNERNGVLHLESPTTYNDPGLIMTKDTFSSQGTIQYEVQHRIISEDYWDGRIFRIDFGEETVTLSENAWSDKNRFIISKSTADPVRLAPATDASEFLNYQMTIDFAAESITRVQRGEETYDIDYDISDIVDSEYSFGFRIGKGVTREYEYIRLNE